MDTQVQKNEFLLEMNRLLGDVLVAPLIEIIVQFARPFYIFVNGLKWQFHFYDHFTRQIVDSQNIPTMRTGNGVKIYVSVTTSPSQKSLFLVDIKHQRILICPLQYNVNKIGMQQNLLVSSSSLQITDTRSSAPDSIIATGDSLFARTISDKSWRRFDFTTQKWDSEEIQDKIIEGRWKNSLNVARIGPRSFVGIETFSTFATPLPIKHRCFVYDGDSIASTALQSSVSTVNGSLCLALQSSDSTASSESADVEQKEKREQKKPVIIELPDIDSDSNITKLLVFGIVKHDQSQQEMILALFHLKIVYIIPIKTRTPSLTFDPPTRINIDKSTIFINQLQNLFILEDQLWVVLSGPKSSSEKNHISYRFSFETMDWIASGRLPGELFNSKLQTIV